MSEDNKKPFFSIVLPVYNVDRYIERCVKSILLQDFDDFEIILVDDGSTDNCPRICDKLSAKESRIKTVHKQNDGLGMARNTGLEEAKGKYIFSDDYILPGLLSEIYAKLSEYDYDAVFYGFKRVDANNKQLNVLIPNPLKDVYMSTEEIKNTLLQDFIGRNPHNGYQSNLRISACNCCWKNDFLKENDLRFVSERDYISEDIYFYTEVFQYLKSVTFIKKAYYCYCQNFGSLTFTYKPQRFAEIRKFYRHIIEYAATLGYPEEVMLRFHSSFVSTTMACLKMEAAQIKSRGLRKTYKRFKDICGDENIINAVNVYPSQHLGKNWKIFFFCVKKKLYFILMLKMILQYYLRGV